MAAAKTIDLEELLGDMKMEWLYSTQEKLSPEGVSFLAELMGNGFRFFSQPKSLEKAVGGRKGKVAHAKAIAVPVEAKEDA